MYRANKTGYTHFDERNQGGRSQVGAELRRFQTAMVVVKPSPEIPKRTAHPCVYLHARKRPEMDHFPPPPCYPPGYTVSSNIDAIWRCSSYQQRQDYRDHCQRLTHLTQHIQHFESHSHARLKCRIPDTNFPGVHANTRNICSPKPPPSVRPKSCGPYHLRSPTPPSRSCSPRRVDVGNMVAAAETSSQYRTKLLAYIRQIQDEEEDGRRATSSTLPDDTNGLQPNDTATTNTIGVDAAEPSSATNNDLPSGWGSAVDDKGRRFYIDHVNKQTTWHRPQPSMTPTASPTPLQGRSRHMR
ncbi:Aste57867_14358 [Aphanomyces stellatus]|uniref:Aste57867_14358 protein n=1 Tax=Aphanomyces stellatus TaxID=120398 RepID=A0A485L254_9STRA|nr:hypothetical protein As57867_014304 [Aphanomyces stellatus]VFT91181.1 Aste57867_14358 [Aphanomyces stellatus]